MDSVNSTEQFTSDDIDFIAERVKEFLKENVEEVCISIDSTE